MSKLIVMPKLNDAEDPGDIRSVYLSTGDTVALGDPVVEVEMEKVILDVEATESGIVKKVQVQVGDKVEVGQPLFELE